MQVILLRENLSVEKKYKSCYLMILVLLVKYFTVRSDHFVLLKQKKMWDLMLSYWTFQITTKNHTGMDSLCYSIQLVLPFE